MEFRIEFRGKYFLVMTSGVAEVKGFGELLDTIFEHKNWKLGGSFITDHSDLDVSLLTAEDVRKISIVARERRSKYGVVKHAVVAPRALTFGLSRMWQAYVGDETDVSSAVFRSLEEAIEWVSA
jgi:hypothetical protein